LIILFLGTVRLALCRNHLLQQAFKELPLLDYYLVMDVDVGSSSLFQINDFLTNFIYPSSSWIAMTATQRSEYYDIWALRLESILPYDCWAVIVELNTLIISRSFLIENIVAIHQKPIPRNHSLIEVQSAFGGAALYNAKYLDKRCLYNGTVGDGYWETYEICEHVPFHQCLRHYAKEQKLYINPQFQIC
jgi:hypothetical protein